MGGSPDRIAANILTARALNAILGGPFISPLELEQMDDALIDAILTFGREHRHIQEIKADTERRFEEWRKAHPTYRKH